MTELDQLDQATKLIHTYGLAGVVAFFMFAISWVLYQVFKPKEGHLTRYVDATIQTQTELRQSAKTQSDALKELSQIRNTDIAVEAERVNIMDRLQTKANVSLEALERMGEEGVQLLTHVCDKLDISEKCSPHITAIRRELADLKAHLND